MKTKHKITYIFLLVLFAIAWGVTAYFFLTQMGAGDPNPEGSFFTPGDQSLEWLLAMNILIQVSLLGTTILAYGISSIFLKSYIKSLGKKRKVGLIPFEDLTSGQLFRKIMIRSIILGFFLANIAYTLASQQFIIDIIRLHYPMQGETMIPDPEVMYHLLWITAIPCVLFLVPIWLMINGGVVSSKKLKGADFETVNLAASPLYKIVKGYAGLGFLYNYLTMILFWAVPKLSAGGSQSMGAVMQLISPIIIIFSMIPAVVLIELQQQKYREKIEKILQKVDLNQDFVNNIELKKR